MKRLLFVMSVILAVVMFLGCASTQISTPPSSSPTTKPSQTSIPTLVPTKTPIPATPPSASPIEPAKSPISSIDFATLRQTFSVKMPNNTYWTANASGSIDHKPVSGEILTLQDAKKNFFKGKFIGTVDIPSELQGKLDDLWVLFEVSDPDNPSVKLSGKAYLKLSGK